IRRHDEPRGDAEWRAFLADHDFGELIAPGAGRDLPIVVPTHFIYDGDKTVLLHLARPNPVWGALDERPRALLSVFGAYTFIPGHWNQDEYGVPTSYYAAVQLACDAEVIDEPARVAAILERQLAHFQPEGRHAPVEPGENRYGKLLGSIRGIRLSITDVRATASALGLSVILATSAEAFTVVKIAGAAYLTYLGVRSLRDSFRDAAAADTQLLRPGTSFLQGLLNNVLNPKVAVFYLTFLPQFIDPAGNVLAQSLAFAVAHGVMGLLWLSAYAYVLARMSAFFQRRGVRRWLERI